MSDLAVALEPLTRVPSPLGQLDERAEMFAAINAAADVTTLPQPDFWGPTCECAHAARFHGRRLGCVCPGCTCRKDAGGSDEPEGGGR